MNNMKLLEEKLREAACIGDQESLEALVYKGVDVNSKNDINGWTALHWAAYRNNVRAVLFLLKNGADKTSLTHAGDMPSDLSTCEKIQHHFGTKPLGRKKPSLPITPNYLRNPPLCCSILTNNEIKFLNQITPTYEKKLVLRVRVAESSESDFIEVELLRSELSYEYLKNICCKELNILPAKFLKIRKLPNVIIRNNNDVLRLQDFQELEIICETHHE